MRTSAGRLGKTIWHSRVLLSLAAVSFFLKQKTYLNNKLNWKKNFQKHQMILLFSDFTTGLSYSSLPSAWLVPYLCWDAISRMTNHPKVYWGSLRLSLETWKRINVLRISTRDLSLEMSLLSRVRAQLLNMLYISTHLSVPHGENV